MIAVTLLRCIGELGDWGYFPTPEAQCHGVHCFNYSIEVHQPEEKFASYHHAIAHRFLFLPRKWRFKQEPCQLKTAI